MVGVKCHVKERMTWILWGVGDREIPTKTAHWVNKYQLTLQGPSEECLNVSKRQQCLTT